MVEKTSQDRNVRLILPREQRISPLVRTAQTLAQKAIIPRQHAVRMKVDTGHIALVKTLASMSSTTGDATTTVVSDSHAVKTSSNTSTPSETTTPEVLTDNITRTIQDIITPVINRIFKQLSANTPRVITSQEEREVIANKHAANLINASATLDLKAAILSKNELVDLMDSMAKTLIQSNNVEDFRLWATVLIRTILRDHINTSTLNGPQTRNIEQIAEIISTIFHESIFSPTKNIESKDSFKPVNQLLPESVKAAKALLEKTSIQVALHELAPKFLAANRFFKEHYRINPPEIKRTLIDDLRDSFRKEMAKGNGLQQRPEDIFLETALQSKLFNEVAQSFIRLNVATGHPVILPEQQENLQVIITGYICKVWEMIAVKDVTTPLEQHTSIVAETSPPTSFNRGFEERLSSQPHAEVVINDTVKAETEIRASTRPSLRNRVFSRFVQAAAGIALAAGLGGIIMKSTKRAEADSHHITSAATVTIGANTVTDRDIQTPTTHGSVIEQQNPTITETQTFNKLEQEVSDRGLQLAFVAQLQQKRTELNTWLQASASRQNIILQPDAIDTLIGRLASMAVHGNARLAPGNTTIQSTNNGVIPEHQWQRSPVRKYKISSNISLSQNPAGDEGIITFDTNLEQRSSIRSPWQAATGTTKAYLEIRGNFARFVQQWIGQHPTRSDTFIRTVPSDL